MNSEAQKDAILVDFQKIFSRIISYWWLYILSVLIAFGIGKLYLRYADFEYSARTVLLIKNTGKNSNISAQNILLSEAGLTSGGKSLDNEIQILKSLTMMSKVVEELRLNISYFRVGQVKETELYKKSPFFVDAHQFNEGENAATYFIDLDNYKTFIVKISEDDKNGQLCHFGAPFVTDRGTFQINLNSEEAIVKGIYRMTIDPILYSAQHYKSNLLIERIGHQKFSSILELSIMDPVAGKTADILNTLIVVYNQEEINDENQIYRNTLDFIDNRVASLVYELDSVDGGIQRFKSANKLISNSASSSMDYTLSEIRNALQQITEYDIKKELLQSLERFLQKKEAYNLIPTSLIADNPVLSTLVSQYNSLALQYKKLTVTATELNPARMALQGQVDDIRSLIIETIQNLQKDIQIPIAKIEGNIATLKRSISSVPSIEKKLIEKMRTQAVKEKLYLFLLQKREETALSEAITTAKTRTIDQARVPGYPIYPRKKMILVFCTVLGLALPTLWILLLGVFQNKIDSEDTIKLITDIPILGKIPYIKNSENVVVKLGNRSEINEMFRLLRTKLSFTNHGKEKQKILITSSIPGEGKTFITINLGITLALSGKKVLLLGLDLRKPKLGTYLKSNHELGITNYLMGHNNIDEITQQFSEQKNLSFITSGPIPPNPAELILADKMNELLSKLSDQYDYILIDTPPIGLVSDALLLRDFVDNMLIVVHYNMTKKEMIKNLDAMNQSKELKNVSLIFNGVKKGSSYYGYSSYNKGYYIDE